MTPQRSHRSSTLAPLATLLLPALVGCGEGAPSKPAGPSAPPPKVQVEAPTAGADGEPAEPGAPGSVAGFVRYVGDPPPRKELAFGSITGCDHGDETPLKEDVIVSDGRLANCIVSIGKGLERYEAPPVPEEPLRLDQQGCVYHPHVSAVRAGQKVAFANSDPTTHNVHHYSRYGGANKSQPAGGADLEFVFEKPEPPLRVGCDIHPWMRCFIGVFDHPFFTVTGADGTFELPDLPPGSYRLDCWHETLGKQQAKIEVPAGGRAVVEFSYPD